MKTVSLSIVLFLLVINSGLAQQDMGNVVVVTKYTLLSNVDGFVSGELDSLTRLYEAAITDGNEFIIDHMTLRHFWGADNTDYVFIYKVKSWEDVPKANDRMNELFEEKWSTEASQKEFNTAYNKYFSGKHSDEIYREVR